LEILLVLRVDGFDFALSAILEISESQWQV
jgi:hypothetical protein